MESTITLIKGDKIGVETDYRDYLPENMLAIERPTLGAKGYMLQSPGLSLLGNGAGIDRGGIWNEQFNDHYRVIITAYLAEVLSLLTALAYRRL
jgi:hypothetical protein